MAGILRGGIRWADLNPTRGHVQAGPRPVLVPSHDVFNERSGTIIAVALSRAPPRAAFPLTLQLVHSKLPMPSWVKISQIQTSSVERIGNAPGQVTPEEIAQVLEGLNKIIGA